MQAKTDDTVTTQNGQDGCLYLLQGHSRIPVKFDIFKHGGGIYLALVNQERGVHIPLIANVATMRLELEGVLYRIELAASENNQGYISQRQR